MPKRKATFSSQLSGLVGSDDEDDLMRTSEAESAARDERPVKRAKGRPRSAGSITTKSKTGAAQERKARPAAKAQPAAPHAQDEAPRKSARTGRTRGTANTSDVRAVDTLKKDAIDTADGDQSYRDEGQDASDDDDMDSSHPNLTEPAKVTKPVTQRGRRKESAAQPTLTDGEFAYTPTRSKRVKRQQKSTEQQARTTKPRRTNRAVVEQTAVESRILAAEVEVEETFISEEPIQTFSASESPAKEGHDPRVSAPTLHQSPSKHSALKAEKARVEADLRRKLGELTRRYDALESRYKNLKEIGIVEANANMDKLTKQCEAISATSSRLVESLKAELEAQTAHGKQTRSLQKELSEKDREISRLESQAGDLNSQLSSSRAEIQTLQTKLAVARHTAASLEGSATKLPPSAIKGSANSRAQAAAADAAQAAQLAQLKENLYSDLTGLIIRNVKKRDTDHVYDCIQTGINGTLHFKLAVPQVSGADFESAEFQYSPLLDENRDRELISLLPEYLTVDITFSRQQASKFYTRVIDTLTKMPIEPSG